MNLDAQWIAGFVDGEGCFRASLNRHEDMKTGAQVLPEFVVVQHEDDVQLLFALKEHFGCGVVRKNHADRMCFRVRKLEHLLSIIIPFFEQHSLKSRKRADFEKFRRICLMMEKGEHLTESGLEEIRNVTEQMNRKGKSEPLRP